MNQRSPLKRNSQIVGIFWMLLHCFLISCMSVIIRALSDELSIFQIMFFHNIVAMILISAWLLLTKQFHLFKSTKHILHWSRGTLGAISMGIYFYALTLIPLTQARAIALTGPLISSVFAIIFLKEKIGIHRTLALLVGFAGAMVIIRPGSESFSYVSLLVVCAVCMWGAIEIIIKTLGRTESTLTQVFYLSAIMSLLTLPPALYVWKTPDNFFEWFWLITLGVLFMINVIAVFNAFKHADITTVMPFDFSGMVFTIILAFFIFGEVVDHYTFLGSIIIVMSSVYVIKRESKTVHEVHKTGPQEEH